MYKPKLEKDIRCPLEYGLTIFGGKWKSRVICVLAEKRKEHCDTVLSEKKWQILQMPYWPLL